MNANMNIEENYEQTFHERFGYVKDSGVYSVGEPCSGAYQSASEDGEEFRRVVRQTHGAWSAHPWTNHLADIRAMREEWSDHDPWKGVAPSND
jgi:uncharacterized protein YraI